VTSLKKIRSKLIHLHRCRGITRRTIRRLWHHDPYLELIYSLSPSEISQQYHLPLQRARSFYSDLHDFKLSQSVHSDLTKFQVITIVDKNYPSILKTIHDAPLVLYASGNISLLENKPALSVIGTRNPSGEAKRKIKYIINPLIKEGWSIVSGMARGIDSLAHILTLEEQGNTIAVLGGGFNHIYPKQNITLYKRISKNGLVLSEYPPDMPPARFHFPERNRIISGLSFGTLVIEATERSGTLITVDQALDQGREVYAVPGSPLISQTKGCNLMIQDGAKLVISANDIKEDWENFGVSITKLHK